jgi:glycine cleavage system H protein
MPDALTFMMGKYAAHLPGELRYARNHMWCRPEEGRWRFGFTAYAVRLMKDVYFLDWVVDPGAAVQLKQHIGHIETSKAQSDLFAPIAGTLVQFNQELLRDPSAINVDTYGPGWLFDMDGDAGAAMTAAEYYQYLEAGWETTQRILKGHM